MDYRLISNFHPLSTPSNAVCKLSFSTGVRPYRPQPYRPQQDDNNVKEKKYFIGHILVNLELLRQNVFFFESTTFCYDYVTMICQLALFQTWQQFKVVINTVLPRICWNSSESMRPGVSIPGGGGWQSDLPHF